MPDQQPTEPQPRNPELLQWFYRNATPDLCMGERVRQMDRFDAFYEGTQYAGHALDWWNLSADSTETISPNFQVPEGYIQPAVEHLVRAKRPTAPFKLPKAVVKRVSSLLFSENRCPEVMVENDPETEDWLQAVREQCDFWGVMSEARDRGGANGSVLVTFHLREGRFDPEVHNAKHIVLIRWKNGRRREPEAVLKQYIFKDWAPEVDDKGKPTGRMVEADFLYRRIITDQEDIVYKPVQVRQDLQAPWIAAEVVQHDLGLFPGVWIRNTEETDDFDGRPDCDGIYQHVDTSDRVSAQENKAILANLDPQPVLKLSEQTRMEGVGTIRRGSDNALLLRAANQQSGQGEESASLLEYEGGAIERAETYRKTLRQEAEIVTRCVFLDAEKVSGAAQSAKAMEYLFAPMLELGDERRRTYGRAVKRAHEIFIEMGRKVAERGQMVVLPPRVVQKDLPDDAPEDATPEHVVIQRKLGPGGNVKLSWPRYFEATPQDHQVETTNLVALKTAHLIDEDTAIREACRMLRIKDPEAVKRRVKREQQQEMEQALSSFGGAMMDEEPQVEHQQQPPAGGQPKPAPAPQPQQPQQPQPPGGNPPR